MVVESDEVVPWTKPDDLPYAPDKPLPSLGDGPRGNFLVLMADGSVRFIPAKFDQVLLRQAITRNDKQPLDLDRLGTVEPRPAPPGARTRPGRNNRVDRPATAELGRPTRPSPAIGSSSAAACSTRMGSLSRAPQSISSACTIRLGPAPPAVASGGTRGDERARRPVPNSSSTAHSGTMSAAAEPLRSAEILPLPRDRRRGAAVRSGMGPSGRGRRPRPT